MRDSQYGATVAVGVTFLSPTLPRRDCHSDYKFSNDLPIIETYVWKTCTQLLCILDGLKRKSGGRDMYI
jgi:hypothetical protein